MPPTARNGEELGVMNPPTKCPTANPATIDDRPTKAATGMDSPDVITPSHSKPTDQWFTKETKS